MAMVRYPGVNTPAHPRVSICIANYNGESMLSECIESVLVQDVDGPTEILVHDDASQDDSVTLMRNRWPQVHILASDENVGFCVANNRMAALARGEYLLLLNNDAALNKDAVRMLLAEAEGLSTAAILTLPQYDWNTGVLVDRGCLLDPFYTPIPNLVARRHDVAYVIGACMFMPRTLWQALGGFPEWFDSIAEDMYLCCAARLRGAPVRCIDASGYRHRQGASFGGNRIGDKGLETNYRRRYLSERNRLAVLISCTPTWIAWPWLGVCCAFLMAEGALLSLLKLDTRVLRHIYTPAVSDTWHQSSRILKTRRALQTLRRIGLREFLATFSPIPRKVTLLLRHGLPDFRP